MNKKMGIHPCWLVVVISVILCSLGAMFQISANATTNNKNISRNRLSPLFTRSSGNSPFYLHMGSISISVPTQKESFSTTQVQKQDAIRNSNTDHTYVQPENGVITENNNYSFHDTASFSLTEGIQNEPDSLSSKSTYGEKFHFETILYLPLYLGSRNLNDPQSAAFSEDNRYLYVMYVDGSQATSSSQLGWVVRYDWQKLMSLKANQPGRMAMLRIAAAHQDINRVTKFDQQVLSAIEVGPKFVTGHAQSLALNPKTNELWYVQSYGHTSQNIVARLNTQTLTADYKVQFSMSRFGMESVLTFDRSGEAFYWIDGRSSATNTGGNATLYHGSISSKGAYFTAFSQGIAINPTFGAQSIGYNEHNNRLYLVANDGIISFSLTSVGKLKPNEISESNFSETRELEGLVFMHNSDNGFLLTNRGPEMMQMVAGS